jgi:hypothetical protein
LPGVDDRVVRQPTVKADPRLQLQTLFVTDARQRTVSTREPNPSAAPAFVLVRGKSTCAWAVRADVPESAALELDRLASEETPSADWGRPLRHAERYSELLGGRFRSGPAFEFPEQLGEAGNTVAINDVAELSRHFSGWVADQCRAGDVVHVDILAVRPGSPGVKKFVAQCPPDSPAGARHEVGDLLLVGQSINRQMARQQAGRSRRCRTPPGTGGTPVLRAHSKRTERIRSGVRFRNGPASTLRLHSCVLVCLRG